MHPAQQAATLASWQSSGAYMHYEGQQIFWVQSQPEADDKPVLLLIHGFPTASWDFHHQWPKLATQFRLVTFDMLGFGYSDKPTDHDYTMVEQANIAKALLQQLGISEAHLLAHDYGVSVAQELLAQDQEAASNAISILSVCFLNGGIFPEQHRPTLKQHLLHSPLGFIFARSFNKKRFKVGFSEVFGDNSQPTEQEIDEFWALISHNQGVRVMHKLIRYIDERKLHRNRWVQALQNSTKPLRLINGPNDPVSGLHAAKYFEEMVPHGDVKLLPGIGHYPQVEAPDAVLDEALAFFNQAIESAAR